MIHDNIRRIMKRKMWSQERLAMEVGRSQSTIHGWVSGRTVPNAYAMLDLAKALKVDIEELYKGAETWMQSK